MITLHKLMTGNLPALSASFMYPLSLPNAHLLRHLNGSSIIYVIDLTESVLLKSISIFNYWK